MSDTIKDLREELFKTLRGLTDKSDPMDIERAKAVADIGQTIINTAKVEIDFVRLSGGTGTGFIEEMTGNGTPPLPTKTATGTVEHQGGKTVHRIRG